MKLFVGAIEKHFRKQQYRTAIAKAESIEELNQIDIYFDSRENF